jgi:hypothetical protein
MICCITENNKYKFIKLSDIIKKIYTEVDSVNITKWYYYTQNIIKTYYSDNNEIENILEKHLYMLYICSLIKNGNNINVFYVIDKSHRQKDFLDDKIYIIENIEYNVKNIKNKIILINI